MRCRYSGCWVGFEAISDTIESSSSFEIDPMAVEIKVVDSYSIPADGFHIRWPGPPLEQENRLQRERLYALLEYVRLNGLNRQDWLYRAVDGTAHRDLHADGEFPHEILRPPHSVAARMYSDIRRWTTQSKGGHFAAMEQPEVLAHETREFFRPLRAKL